MSEAMVMTRQPSLGGWPFWTSVVLHVVGLGAVSAVAATSTATRARP
jgi:hypothetical protein